MTYLSFLQDPNTVALPYSRLIAQCLKFCGQNKKPSSVAPVIKVKGYARLENNPGYLVLQGIVKFHV